MMPYWNPHRPDGSLASIKDGTWKGEGQNPLEWLANNKISYKKYKVISTLFAEAPPIEGLTIRSIRTRRASAPPIPTTRPTWARARRSATRPTA